MRQIAGKGPGRRSYDEKVTSTWWLRWVMVILGAAIGAVLLLGHHVLIGIVILAMALIRALVLVSVRKRRAARRARRAAGRFGLQRF